MTCRISPVVLCALLLGGCRLACSQTQGLVSINSDPSSALAIEAQYNGCREDTYCKSLHGGVWFEDLVMAKTSDAMMAELQNAGAARCSVERENAVNHRLTVQVTCESSKAPQPNVVANLWINDLGINITPIVKHLDGDDAYRLEAKLFSAIRAKLNYVMTSTLRCSKDCAARSPEQADVVVTQ